MKKNARRTIIVGKKYQVEDDEEKVSVPIRKIDQPPFFNNQAASNTAGSVEIIIQLFLEEIELLRIRIRGAGQRMRHFLVKNATETIQKVRRFITDILDKSAKKRSVHYRQEESVVFNQEPIRESYKPPRYTLNDIREVLMDDELEEGVVQRRTPVWEKIPTRVVQSPVDDGLCEFQKLNVPMAMHFDDEDDRLSMPSTKTMMTTEDQMNAIHAQLAILSRQLMNLQKSNVPSAVATSSNRASSRASSIRGARVKKMPSLEADVSTSSSSEDEGKGPSVCSPTYTRKNAGRDKKLAPLVSNPPPAPPLPPTMIAPLSSNAPPPPPPPPPPTFAAPSMTVSSTAKLELKPVKIEEKVLPPEVVSSERPYLIDIVNGRQLLKKTIKSPGGSPAAYGARPRRVLNSFEEALKERFRGFHGENSFSEQEGFGDDDEEGVDQVWN